MMTDVFAQTNPTQAQDLVTVLWLIIGVVVVFFLALLAYRWWNATPVVEEPKTKYPSWFRPAGTPETEHLDKVVVSPGDVTSVRVVNPNTRCGDSGTGEIEHYQKRDESARKRPTFGGGFTEMLDPDTGRVIGEYPAERQADSHEQC